MTKLQAKFSKLIEAVTKNEQDVHEHLNEVTLAQNQSGVLVMSILQLLIEKGLVSREEVEDRFEKSKELALDEDGGCKISLTSLLDGSSERGTEDEHGGS